MADGAALPALPPDLPDIASTARAEGIADAEAGSHEHAHRWPQGTEGHGDYVLGAQEVEQRGTPKRYIICSLDLATRTGWAIGAPGQTPRWGTVDCGGEQGGTGEVISRFRRWLNGFAGKPDLLVFEAPYLARGPKANLATFRRLAVMVGQVEALCWERGIRCREATALQIAKFFIGTQRLKRADKKAATIAMCRRLGWEVEDDNAADALALWAMAEATIDPAAGRARGVGPLFVKTGAPRRLEPTGRGSPPATMEACRGQRHKANNTSSSELQLSPR